MTDFLVPVLVGATAALLPFLAHWYWARRRDSADDVRPSLLAWDSRVDASRETGSTGPGPRHRTV